MNLSDIMALAKQGYKPADIKELMSMAEPEPTEPTEPVPPQPEPTPGPAPTQTQTGTDNAQIEAMQKQIAELQTKLEESNKALKTAQRVNTQQNVQPVSGQSDAERLNDWARSFM